MGRSMVFSPLRKLAVMLFLQSKSLLMGPE